MKYNYSAMKQKFDNEQKKLAAQYHAAGMSEEAIKEMHEFDLKAFRLQRNDIIHKAEIEEMTSYDRVTGEAHYKDMDEFPAAEYQRHFRCPLMFLPRLIVACVGILSSLWSSSPLLTNSSLLSELVLLMKIA